MITMRIILVPLFLLLLCLKAWPMWDKLLSDQEKYGILKKEWDSQSKSTFKYAVISDKEKLKDKNIKKADFPQKYLRKINLMAKDIKLSEVLKPLEKAIGGHVILGPEVEDKKISVSLSDIEIHKALNTILFPLGYSFKIKEDDLIVLAIETRIYQISLPPLSQNFSDITSNESSSGSQDKSVNSISNNNSNNEQIRLGTKILVSNESTRISFWDDIVENLKMLISTQGKFSINKPAGVVVVTDAPVNIEKISQYFDDLNNRVTQQIEVDVKVVEVILEKENNFGVDWNALATNLKTFNHLGIETNFASQNFQNSSFLKISGNGSRSGSGLTESGISLVIEALAKQGKVEVVSQPRIKILNNQLAVIQVGSTQSFVNNSTVQVTQTGTITSISTSEVQEGVTMRLLGSIVGDQIYLSVSPVITTIDKIRSINSGTTTIEAPQTTTKSINTLVKVKDGESVAIGGLITSNHQKNKQEAPLLSKLPFVGKLFQYSQEIENKRELVIIITPRRT